VKQTPQQKLLDPRPGSKIAAARDFGIDLTLLAENLKLAPADRIKANDQAVNDLVKFEDAMKRAKRASRVKGG
jgi:hypothetical protein